MKGFHGAIESRLSGFWYQSLMPAGTGTPGYEIEDAGLGAFDSPSPQSSSIKGEEEEHFPHGSRPCIGVRGTPSAISGLLKCVAQTARARWAEDTPPRYINQSLQSSGS